MTDWVYHCSHCNEPLNSIHSNNYDEVTGEHKNKKYDYLYEFECPVCRHIDIFAKDMNKK